LTYRPTNKEKSNTFWSKEIKLFFHYIEMRKKLEKMAMEQATNKQ